jgi:hypothetical protein
LGFEVLTENEFIQNYRILKGGKKQELVANNMQNEKPATTKGKRVERQVRTKLIK